MNIDTFYNLLELLVVHVVSFSFKYTLTPQLEDNPEELNAQKIHGTVDNYR